MEFTKKNESDWYRTAHLLEIGGRRTRLLKEKTRNPIVLWKVQWKEEICDEEKEIMEHFTIYLSEECT